MIKQKHLLKLKKFIKNKSDGINLAQSILCSIALGEKLSPNFLSNRKNQQILSGFRRYKFVRSIKVKDGSGYVVTQKGENKLQDMLIDEVSIKQRKNWDGKWYLVMYDLPIRFKRAREAFRWKLKDLGFFQFQKSAWIYPYTCEEEVLFVADFFGVCKYIEILEVNKILDDKKIKEYFCL